MPMISASSPERIMTVIPVEGGLLLNLPGRTCGSGQEDRVQQAI